MVSISDKDHTRVICKEQARIPYCHEITRGKTYVIRNLRVFHLLANVKLLTTNNSKTKCKKMMND